MEEDRSPQPTTESSAPLSRSPWLRVVLLVVVIAVIGIGAWLLIGDNGDDEVDIPTRVDIERRGAKMIVRIEEDEKLLSVAVEPDGTGAMFQKTAEGDIGEAESLTLEPDAVRAVGVQWLEDGFFALRNADDTTNATRSIQAVMAAGEASHTVRCAESCPPVLEKMAARLIALLPGETPDFDLPAIE